MKSLRACSVRGENEVLERYGAVEETFGPSAVEEAFGPSGAAGEQATSATARITTHAAVIRA
jgi:hypothetical protein